jgi:rfaE bifunctional protein nucleotidyltransferase chain/domain
MSIKNKCYQADQTASLVCKLEKERKAGKRIVATSGCFDILHAGHVTYLEEARAKGDILVVMLNTDCCVQRLKGKERPIVPQKERMQVIAGLQSVNYVILFEEDTPCTLISQMMPDVFVKGGDYRGKDIPEMTAVAEYGGRVEYVSLVEGCSSTNIIEKIKALIKESL